MLSEGENAFLAPDLAIQAQAVLRPLGKILRGETLTLTIIYWTVDDWGTRQDI